MAEYIKRDALKKRFAKRLDWLKRDIHDEYSGALYDCCEVDIDLIDEIPTADVAPIETLERLQDELYEQNLITMEGLRKLDTLIGKYTTMHDGGAEHET